MNETTTGKGKSIFLDLLDKGYLSISDQGPVFCIEMIICILPPNKIEHREAFFSFTETEAPAYLLDKNSHALGRTKEKDCINFRNIHSFIVDVDDKNETNLFCLNRLWTESRTSCELSELSGKRYIQF